MPLVTLQDAELAFGLQPLLDRAALTVDDGERIGLIGRNGTGKSSLLAVLAGTARLDDGEVKRQDGLAVVLVEQEPQLPRASTLRESLALKAGLAAADPAHHDERERAYLYPTLDRVTTLEERRRLLGDQAATALTAGA